MGHVLEALLAHARTRAARMSAPAGPRPVRASLRQAIAGKAQLSVIAEWKRASPSEGTLSVDHDFTAQLRAYAKGGAAAISVLTEDSRFGGSLHDLRAATQAVEVPLLMKDFVVAQTQVEAAAQLGASAVLLIARALDDHQLRDLAAVCRGLGLDALVECHDEAELTRALHIDQVMIGVNNRDLDTLVIDRTRAERLLPRVPADRVVVAESGYTTPAAARALVGLADAVLIGTALMRSGDPAAFLADVQR